MKLFIYGILKIEKQNHNILQTSKFICNDTINGTMYDLIQYPAIDINGNNTIYGEVYEIDKDTLNECDVIKGHPLLFKRIEIKTKKGYNCWVYYIPYPSGTIIKSGKWK